MAVIPFPSSEDTLELVSDANAVLAVFSAAVLVRQPGAGLLLRGRTVALTIVIVHAPGFVDDSFQAMACDPSGRPPVALPLATSNAVSPVSVRGGPTSERMRNSDAQRPGVLFNQIVRRCLEQPGPAYNRLLAGHRRAQGT